MKNIILLELFYLTKTAVFSKNSLGVPIVALKARLLNKSFIS